mmetsp:Transcript_22212/g.52631  ORF Transcript_22212/g.52631 Transcript_22212/m.52631 type:complete len:200 (+) Transcript_22212:2188-2787(+)
MRCPRLSRALHSFGRSPSRVPPLPRRCSANASVSYRPPTLACPTATNPTSLSQLCRFAATPTSTSTPPHSLASSMPRSWAWLNPAFPRSYQHLFSTTLPRASSTPPTRGAPLLFCAIPSTAPWRRITPLPPVVSTARTEKRSISCRPKHFKSMPNLTSATTIGSLAHSSTSPMESLVRRISTWPRPSSDARPSSACIRI